MRPHPPADTAPTPTAQPPESSSHAADGDTAAATATDARDAAIPEDARVAREDLPEDLFDTPATPPAPRARARAAPNDELEPPARDDRSWSAAHAAPGATELRRALLGTGPSDATPGAVQDAVQAILELFPGEVVAVTPRDSGDDADDTPAVPGEDGLEPDDELGTAGV